MVTAFVPVQGSGWPDTGDHTLQQLRRGKRVPRSLHEQHWKGEPVEVLVAQFLRLARRMQRIAEVHQPGRRHSLGHGHGGHPAAERLAGSPHRARVRVRRGPGSGLRHGGTPGGDGKRRPVREFPSGLAVREVEAQSGDAVVVQRVGEARHEGMLQACAGAVRKHKCCGRLLRPGVDAGDLDIADSDGYGGFGYRHESMMPDLPGLSRRPG
ncbi:hypothetical protein D9M72_521740 [compost metagenome]